MSVQSINLIYIELRSKVHLQLSILDIDNLSTPTRDAKKTDLYVFDINFDKPSQT